MIPFNHRLNDSQGTLVTPIAPEKFDFDRYIDYETAMLQKHCSFWNRLEGISVYRRFRVPQVFSWLCRDMRQSLALQLGALQCSMAFPADVANFLEPWYGIGLAASAFGAEYTWSESQAPAIAPMYRSATEALDCFKCPIEQTAIGKRNLEMLEYFLESTRGNIPISFSDVQSPLNVLSTLLHADSLYLELYDHIDDVIRLLDLIAELTLRFLQIQKDMIGDALVLPGHGFASSRRFKGLGMSSDVLVNISGEMYRRFEVPVLKKFAAAFNGYAFHSCGNWSHKLADVQAIYQLKMVDAAFSSETDPDPNSCEPFRESLQHSGVILNARMVGDAATVLDIVKQLVAPEMRFIVVTYCQTPEEQRQVYEQLHTIARC